MKKNLLIRRRVHSFLALHGATFPVKGRLYFGIDFPTTLETTEEEKEWLY